MQYWLPAFLILLLLYMRLEASWLEVCRHTVSNKAGLRVVVVSDLHIVFCRISAKRVQRGVAAEKPDMFVFLGDAIDRRAHIRPAVNWLKTAANGRPAVAILGNHDHRLFARHPELFSLYEKALQEAGIRLRVNESFFFDGGRHPLKITALDDAYYGETALPAHTGTNTPFPENAAPVSHLLLTHNPQRLVALPEGYADFAVAGHFHGGQIWMPFGLEFKLFRKEPLGRAGVRRGLHTIGGIPTWLTRGIGNVLFPLRLGARPEITILEL